MLVVLKEILPVVAVALSALEPLGWVQLPIPPSRMLVNEFPMTPHFTCLTSPHDGTEMRALGVLGLALVGVAQVSAFVAPAGPLGLQQQPAAGRRAGASSSVQPLVPIASPSSLLSAVSEP